MCESRTIKNRVVILMYNQIKMYVKDTQDVFLLCVVVCMLGAEVTESAQYLAADQKTLFGFPTEAPTYRHHVGAES